MEILRKIFLEGVEWGFVWEILLRAVLMFILVLLVLRLSGKRGVRQLTLFEVAIILSLGSAAGDPMFQEEVPLLYGAVVLFVVILIYKLVAWMVAKSEWFGKVMEGEALVIVREGRFEVKNERGGEFSKDEFLAELRNQSVEHLGQVRLGVLEVDGTLSLLFYDKDRVRPGLPIFPGHYKVAKHIEPGQLYACMYCGYTSQISDLKAGCAQCEHREWALAIDTIHYSK